MMLKISNLFLSTIFLLCFYIDQIQLDDSLFENIKYLENEEVKLPQSSDWKDSNVVGISFFTILSIKFLIETEDEANIWFYPYYKDAMVYRSLKYVYLLAQYGSMAIKPNINCKPFAKFNTAVYTISNYFKFIYLENEVLENIRNVLENFKNSPKEPYSVPHFEIIHHVFSEIINIIDNYFKGENLLKYSAEVPFIPLPIGGNNWETYESVLSKKLKKDYYPPTKIENNNKELIEALNMLITKVVDEYKITLNGYENKKEE
ncbi:uncharacterized protein LOC126899209 isoform X2 [Daktulosphaira vitifoliae]|uniref:uncharacterized protein LOC126899209 isoform X2 n=1 Tax=Daktulosphaira vitifoliae TaxID=58002 RepID=UPI0021AAE759|nr:uncharacterized protein LOC126899209 isoform X2 [Daktulosphaira vitifoliae]